MAARLVKVDLDPKAENYDDTKRVNEKVPLEDVDIPPLGVPVQKPGFGRRDQPPLDSIATQPSVFDDPTSLEVYRPPPEFENAHRFDPLARWTWREERVSSGLSSRSPGLVTEPD